MISLQEIDLSLPFEPIVHTLDDIKQIQFDKQNSLKLLYLNARSISNKIEDLNKLLTTINETVHLIAISESWLKDDSSCLNINNYNVVSVTRSGSRVGGGVVLLIHHSITNYDCIYTYSDEFLSILSVKLIITNREHIVSVIYNPPNRGQQFIEVLETFMNSQKNKNSIIIGDVNINLLQSDSVCKQYKSILSCNNFYICDSFTPTRLQSGTVLDHVLVNDVNQTVTLNHIDTDISDHNIIVCEFNKVSVETSSKNKNVQIKSINYKKILRSYEEKQLKISSDLSVNEMICVLIDDIKQRTDDATTIKEKRIKSGNVNLKPWFNGQIEKVIEYKHFWYLKLKNYRMKPNQNQDVLENMHQEYKFWRNKYTSTKRKIKQDYFDRKFCENISSSRGTWNTIKDVLYDGVRPNSNQIKLDINGVEVCDEKKISDEFNKHFIDVGESINRQIKCNSYVSTSRPDNGNKGKFLLYPTNEGEVQNVIKNLKNTNSSGLDEIKTKVIKICSRHLLTSLVKILNKSFSDGTFPDVLKTSKVLPFFKNGSRKDKNNYRPISLLSVLSKIFEVIFKIRLMKYLKENSILCNEQYGFRPNSNTQIALYDLITEIESEKKNEKTAAVFIDLQKAFDSVNHLILLSKLKEIGFSEQPMNWIRSYLFNRTQIVNINGIHSEELKIKLGVPQGSILGPILFLLFINDLKDVGLRGKMFLYADDIATVYHDQSYTGLETAINQDLKMLSCYMRNSRLALNVSKTQYMIFNTPSNIFLKIEYDSLGLQRADKFKYLGVTLDVKLNFKNHIDLLKSKLSSVAGVFWRISNCIRESTKRMLYFAFFSSLLEYGIEFFGASTIGKTAELQVIQNRAIKNLFNLDRLTSTVAIHKDFKILRVKDMFQLKLMKLVHSVDNKLLHSNTKIILNNQIHHHNTRQAGDIHIVNHHSSLSQFNNQYNKVDIDTRKLNKNMFLKSMKELIFSNFLSENN